MTTELLTERSVVTLRDRAIAAAEARDAVYADVVARERREQLARLVDVLRIKLRDHLGIESVDAITEPNDPHTPDKPIALVDGIPFSLRDLPYADSYRDRDQLHVMVPCARKCGKDLWVSVDSIEDLGDKLTSRQEHGFACLEQFDDEGQPTTDKQGNPLGPFSDRRAPSSPWQRVSDRIASIEDAAREMAIAQERVTRFEDERAPKKAEAIKRLMQQTNDLTGKLHSASSAEAVVELDAEYAEYRAMQRDAEVERHRTIAAYEIAKLTAQLAVESFVVEERNR